MSKNTWVRLDMLSHKLIMSLSKSKKALNFLKKSIPRIARSVIEVKKNSCSPDQLFIPILTFPYAHAIVSQFNADLIGTSIRSKPKFLSTLFPEIT